MQGFPFSSHFDYETGIEGKYPQLDTDGHKKTETWVTAQLLPTLANMGVCICFYLIYSSTLNRTPIFIQLRHIGVLLYVGMCRKDGDLG